MSKIESRVTLLIDASRGKSVPYARGVLLIKSWHCADLVGRRWHVVISLAFFWWWAAIGCLINWLRRRWKFHLATWAGIYYLVKLFIHIVKPICYKISSICDGINVRRFLRLGRLWTLLVLLALLHILLQFAACFRWKSINIKLHLITSIRHIYSLFNNVQNSS